MDAVTLIQCVAGALNLNILFRLLVRELQHRHEQGDVISLDWFGILAITRIETASG